MMGHRRVRGAFDAPTKRGLRRRERRSSKPVYDPADDMRLTDHVQYAEDWEREDFMGEYPWDEENLCDDHP